MTYRTVASRCAVARLPRDFAVFCPINERIPMPRMNHGLVLLGAVMAVLIAAPAAAQPGNCLAPAEAVGGPSNAHTRYIEANLQPPVVEPGAKPFRLAERMRQ